MFSAVVFAMACWSWLTLSRNLAQLTSTIREETALAIQKHWTDDEGEGIPQSRILFNEQAD